jgi:hypothetical protein
MLLPGFCNIQCNMSTVNNAYYCKKKVSFLIYFICLCLRIVVSNIYIVVFLLCLSLSCVLCHVCPLLPVLLATHMADARHRYQLCTSYVNILKPNCNISNLNRVYKYLGICVGEASLDPVSIPGTTLIIQLVFESFESICNWILFVIIIYDFIYMIQETHMADARHRYQLCRSYVNILKPNCNISNLNRVYKYLIRKLLFLHWHLCRGGIIGSC